MAEADFDTLMELVVHGFEVAGVLVLVVGAVTAFASALVTARRTGTGVAYERVRPLWGAPSSSASSCSSSPTSS